MVERRLVKKVSFSSLEMSVVKKSIAAWLDWAKKITIKVQKVFLKIGHDFGKLDMILKVGYDFENWV
jgi:predicted hydrocarbon binding protein